MRMRWVRRSAAAALVVAASLVVSPASGDGRPVQLTTTLAPGVTLTRITQDDPPERIRVLTIDPSEAVTFDVALASRRLPAFRKTSKMARDHEALAAVNGDFGLYPGYPTHAFAEDADLKTTAVHGTEGKVFAISRDEQQVFIGRPDVAVTVEQPATTEVWDLKQWNEQGRPPEDEVGGYTKAGGDWAPPPSKACSARLVPDGGRLWAPGEAGISREYTVGAVVCRDEPLPLRGGIG